MVTGIAQEIRKDEKNLVKKEEEIIVKEEKIIQKEGRFLFHKIQYLKKHHQILFGLIIVTGVIFVWRGIWNFIDTFWFPHDVALSNISGILVGTFILWVAHKVINQLAGS